MREFDLYLKKIFIDISVFHVNFFFFLLQHGRGMAEGDFNDLSKAAVERGGGEVAKLLNFMLVRDWPRRRDGGEVNDEQLITHLLTWPNWKGFLKYFG